MKVLRFDLERPELEYYFHELYQAFDPGIKNVLSGEAEGVLSQKTIGNEIILSLSWPDKCTQTLSYLVEKVEMLAENGVYKGFLYDFLSAYFEKSLKWGTLTGIKPVKMIQKYLREGWDYEKIRNRFMTYYRVSADRTDLIIEIAKKQSHFLLDTAQERQPICIYVGVPLCPSKCDYCSFVSTIVDKKGENLQRYFENLLVEIKKTGEWLASTKHRVVSVYIGGGTPTVLSVEQLDRLFHTLSEAFDLSGIMEYTLEAGRSETIDEKKLAVAKAHGVGRICLNPQSMNPDTLRRVHRPWEAGLIEKQVENIRKAGFKTLNMDLIAGLGEETSEEFFKSLDALIALHPENITIHNLSIKKGSKIKSEQGIAVKKGYGENFYQAVKKRLQDEGLTPYYLYRLKYTQGNSENIGYSKPGHEGRYNILMMAECCTTIGIGAGATGNLFDQETDCIQKVFTVKDVKTYNERFEEILEKKHRAYQGRRC